MSVANEGAQQRVVGEATRVAAGSPAPPVSYAGAIFGSLAAGLVLGSIGAWVCTILWFGVYGSRNLLSDFVSGLVAGFFFALIIGPVVGVAAALPTGVAVAWMRNRGKAVRTVRYGAAVIAGMAMLLLILFGLDNGMESSTLDEPQTRTSFGWVGPVAGALWSAGWAYLLSVRRRTVIVVVNDPTTANNGT